MKKVIAYIPINLGHWQGIDKNSYGGAIDGVWHNMYFVEQVIDWSDLPKNSFGKLMAELKNGSKDLGSQRGRIGIRLAYQQKRGEWIPLEGSEIYSMGGKRWELKQSDWFKLPTHVKGVSCLWIQGMEEEGSSCQIALVNLVIAEEV